MFDILVESCTSNYIIIMPGIISFSPGLPSIRYLGPSHRLFMVRSGVMFCLLNVSVICVVMKTFSTQTVMLTIQPMRQFSLVIPMMQF